MMPEGSGRGGDIVETTRDRILRVAAEMFAEKGYHGTSVASIGAAAGIQRGALYYHIGSKEELLYDLSKRHVEEALERCRRVVASDLEPVEKLRVLAREHLAALVPRRAEVIVVTREMHSLTGERADRLRELRDEHQELFRRVLDEGVVKGVFVSSDPVAVLGVLGMYNWTYVWFDAAHGTLPIEAIADRLTDMLVYGQLRQDARNGPVEQRIDVFHSARGGT
jgi:AcrR family transcriptional regulator